MCDNNWYTRCVYTKLHLIVEIARSIDCSTGPNANATPTVALFSVMSPARHHHHAARAFGRHAAPHPIVGKPNATQRARKLNTRANLQSTRSFRVKPNKSRALVYVLVIRNPISQSIFVYACLQNIENGAWEWYSVYRVLQIHVFCWQPLFHLILRPDCVWWLWLWCSILPNTWIALALVYSIHTLSIYVYRNIYHIANFEMT